MKSLELISVSKAYSTGLSGPKIQALHGVSFAMQPGEILTVLGRNGAGKTTLVKILAGLIDPDRGRVLMDGVVDVRSPRARRRTGVLLEGNRNIYWRLSAWENIEYFGVLRGLRCRDAREQAERLLERFGLTDKSCTIAAKLSRGMQQRLALAISVVHRPEILVLDEPTLGVDVENVLEIIALLKSLAKDGAAILVTSHQLDFVKQVAERIALLAAGRLIALETQREFLGHSLDGQYVLEMSGDISEQITAQLAAMGVRVAGRTISFPQSLLYPVLDCVRPLPIGCLRSEGDDLTAVFLHRTRTVEHV